MHQFLFDSQHASLSGSAMYGPPCIQRVVQAIEHLDPMPTTRLIWGDVLAHRGCYKLARFHLDKKSNTRSVVHTDEYGYEPDNELFKTTVCDLAETLSEPPSTARAEKLLGHLARGSIWAVGATHLSGEQALRIDKALRGFPPYLGMAKIDLGNPLHREVMFELMMHRDIILSPEGLIYLARTYLPPEDQAEALYWVKLKGSTKPPIGLDPEQFEAALPPVEFPHMLSERGQLTADRVAGKAQLTYRQRLTRALLEVMEKRKSEGPIEFSTANGDGMPEFELDSRKFTEYLLNTSHPKGGGKAKFFSEHLGIERSDWAFLADQIRRGVLSAPLYRLDKTKWGFTHGALVFVTGRNGNTAILETGWSFAESGPARFVTAYPYDGESPSGIAPTDPYVVSPALEGDARWAAIYERGVREGELAAERVKPTPMALVGFRTEWEGMCGFGWVHFPSARKPMPKWLLKNDLGRPARPGVTVWSRAATQSLERNRAWAEAFAAVVQANGIECTAYSRVD